MKPSKRDGYLIIGIGLGLLAHGIALWANGQTVYLTDDVALMALWPAWLLVAVLTGIALWLLEKSR